MPEFKHEGKDKKVFVQKMFDDISKQYDFLNHFLSLGTDIYWRRQFIKKLNISDNSKILDVACGTGDVCFEINKQYDVQITGLDISKQMILIANKKAKRNNITKIKFIQGDGENLPIKSNSIDYLTISYGFRNISNYDLALNEFFRVLKPGGKLGILEFSKSKSKIISSTFNLYFNHILPKIGSLFSRSDAYRYLPESVDFFPNRKNIQNKMENSGFQQIKIIDLTFGISSIFLGYKLNED
tara:strand:+ start:251 stop:973 length:723 start_codon:yes stop_codon:yes gene_type:complete